MILIAGASGYVGGRLLGALEAAGRPVRCLARRPDSVRAGLPTTETVPGDVGDEAALRNALRGVDLAYYLVHAMADPDPDFASREAAQARTFASAASSCGVRRIVYLGGLGRGGDAHASAPPALSPHLASRQETGRLLAGSGVPVVELRAAVILGAGSLSFEMIRSLVDKLPVMVTPRWVRTPTQPIGIDDVVALLLEAGGPAVPPGVYEIGGPDRVTYGGLMMEYARQTGRRRFMIPVPVLTPWLSGLWLALVTPHQARIGRALLDGVRNATVVTDPSMSSVFRTRPAGMAEAIRRALEATPPEQPALRGRASLAALALSLAACFAAAAVGGMATSGGVRDWYPALAKPAWTPPAWLFGPVWTLLYTLMGIAAWRVVRRDGVAGARLPLLAHAGQLALNALWSILFFHFRSPLAALLDIVALLFAILATALLFHARDRAAGFLLLPYLLWTGFAAALNFEILRLNR